MTIGNVSNNLISDSVKTSFYSEDADLSHISKKCLKQPHLYKSSEHNGELFGGIKHEVVWLLGDFILAVRSAVSICTLAGTALTGAAFFVPASLFMTGTIAVATSCKWMIPQAKESLGKAESNLEQIKKTLKKNSSLVQSPITNAQILKDAENKVTIEKINVCNQRTFFAVGAGEIIAGVGTVLTQPGKVVIQSPVLAGSVAVVALTAIGTALGLIYVARGLGMIIRAWKCLNIISFFHKEFRLELSKGPKSAIAFIENTKARFKELGRQSMVQKDLDRLKELEKKTLLDLREQEEYKSLIKKEAELGLAYFNQRVGHKVAEKIMGGAIDLHLLAEMDEAIHVEKSKQWVLSFVGSITLVGGIGTFIALLFTGGSSALIIGMATAAFSLVSEFALVPYDCLWLTKRLSYLSYTKPPSLNLVLQEIPSRS